MPVPNGIIGTLWVLHNFTIFDTSSFVLGNTTAWDKIGSKKNSLFKNQKGVKQQSIQGFSNKIKLAVKAKKSENFLVIARIESFILGKKIGDALKRAEAYSKAGVDAILIHSKSKTPNEIFNFAKKFRKSKYYNRRNI